MSYFILFGGYYQEPNERFLDRCASTSTRGSTRFRTLHVSAIPAKSDARRRARVRSLAIELMKRFNWHIGDRITLHSVLWANNKDGSSDWPVDIVGTAIAGQDDDRTFANEMYFNYDYLDAARTARTGTVNQFVVSLDSRRRSGRDRDRDRPTVRKLEQRNDDDERAGVVCVQHAPGRRRADVRQLDHRRRAVHAAVSGRQHDVAIGGAIDCRNSACSRHSGFGDTSIWLLVVAEAMVLSLIAAAIGLAIAATVFPGVFEASGFGPIPMPSNVYMAGFAIALLLALLSAAVPAVRARRLTVVEALSGR